MGLRVVFVSVNGCEEKALAAGEILKGPPTRQSNIPLEVSTVYTTFDNLLKFDEITESTIVDSGSAPKPEIPCHTTEDASVDGQLLQNKLAEDVGPINAHALLDHFYWSAFPSSFGNRVRDGIAHGQVDFLFIVIYFQALGPRYDHRGIHFAPCHSFNISSPSL